MMANLIQEFRIGLIKVRICRKRTRWGARHTISIVRMFRNGDIWKESTRFSRDDIPQLRLALDLAHTWILTKSQTTL